MSSQACAGFAASESPKATTEIDHEDKEDVGMKDAEEGNVNVMNYFINFLLFLSYFISARFCSNVSLEYFHIIIQKKTFTC